jgi:hypothetical protein
MKQTQEGHILPFGKHKDEPLPAVPTSYLAWLMRECHLSVGLAQAVADELRSRGVEVAPPAPKPPPQCQRCGERTAITYTWHEDSAGRRRIKRMCRCGYNLGFAPHVEPYLSMANANHCDTPFLDVLIQAETLGVELVSDGEAVRIGNGWRNATPELKQKLGQVRHQLARHMGDTR